jgi:predicted CxxxxCH...CXXCH cytochrome family protein
VPADALAAGHVDGDQGSIQFGGLAVTGSLAPAWDHAAETCATTYCHGGGFADGGGTNTTPVWTSVGTGQADCGDCHALPIPDAAHPQPWTGSTWLAADCSLCHAASVDGTGTRLAGHLDGATTPATPLTCTSCHSTYPTAPWHTRISAQATSPLVCSACHDPWRPLGHADGTIQLSTAVSCTSCHGTGDGASTRNAAPPVDVFGGTDANRVGAHAAHLDGETYSNGFECGTCHAGVGSYTLAGHVDALDGTANVVFTGLGAGTVYETDRTCSSSYCHGGTLVGGTTPTPSWSGAIACNSCHGGPPATGRHASHVTTYGVGCGTCHTSYTSTAVNKAQHVNGAKDVSTAALVGWDGANCTTACHTPPGARSWYP